MIRHDLDEQFKAWRALGRDTSAIEEREAHMATVAEALSHVGASAKRLPAMIDLIRAAGEAIGKDPNQFEAAYRICSAATHGKGWAVGELTTQRVVSEWRTGQYHTVSTADPVRVTEMLETASSLLNAAAGLYLKRCGYDEMEDFIRTAYEIASEMPQKDDGAFLAEYGRERGYPEA